MTPDLARALAAVAAVMADARDDWWIIGSAAVALHGGAPVTVADIDVLTSRAEALRLAGLWRATPDPPGDHWLFRSAVHFEHQLAGATVDVMAELEVPDPPAGRDWSQGRALRSLSATPRSMRPNGAS